MRWYDSNTVLSAGMVLVAAMALVIITGFVMVASAWHDVDNYGRNGQPNTSLAHHNKCVVEK